MSTFRDLTVYKKAFQLAMEVFKISKGFPDEEKFGLTSQIRRASRSVCSCIGEAYRKRKYEAHFISKSSDADMENTETQVWLDFSLACEYINNESYYKLLNLSEEIGRLINHMIENPKNYFDKRHLKLTTH